jgi:hypothetical protein
MNLRMQSTGGCATSDTAWLVTCERCGQPFPVRPLCPDCAAWIRDGATTHQWQEVTVVLLPLKLPSYVSQ